jgi:hypothetical protein
MHDHLSLLPSHAGNTLKLVAMMIQTALLLQCRSVIHVNIYSIFHFLFLDIKMVHSHQGFKISHRKNAHPFCTRKLLVLP